MTFPNLDPVLLSFGPLQVRWYGLMYVLGFIMSYWLVRRQIIARNDTALERHFENLNLVLILSVVLGGRLGYVFFYNFSFYLNHPFEIAAIWNGGMSFHGACLTLILTGWLFCRINKLDFWKTADIYIVTIPIGLGLGRIGNFINGELWGRVTDLPWAIIFPAAGPLPRHPSQLYEAALEGLLLFLLLWTYRNKPYQDLTRWPHGSMLALFLCCYGAFRFIIEFAREPDAQVGYLLGLFTMGQFLSVLMIVGGSIIWWMRKKYHT